MANSTPASSKLKLIPSFPKQVFLYDWWLIKPSSSSSSGGGGDRRVLLAIGGLSSKDQKNGIRILNSAAIVKRHNTNTVETSDGLTITFSGSINKSRSLLNGFSIEVCNHFFFGFPFNWEDFSSFGKEAARDDFPKSFDNLPSPMIRDFALIGSSGSVKLRSSFLENVLKTDQVSGDSAMKAKEKRLGPSTRSMSRLKDKRGEDNLLSSLEKNQLVKKKHGGSSLGSRTSGDFLAKGRRLILRNRSIDFNVEDGS